jgi:hypothetical protein
MQPKKNELPRRRACEVSESRPLRYKNQETRAFRPDSWFLSLGSFAQPDYQDATPDAERRGILMIKFIFLGTLKNIY